MRQGTSTRSRSPHALWKLKTKESEHKAPDPMDSEMGQAILRHSFPGVYAAWERERGRDGETPPRKERDDRAQQRKEKEERPQRDEQIEALRRKLTEFKDITAERFAVLDAKMDLDARREADARRELEARWEQDAREQMNGHTVNSGDATSRQGGAAPSLEASDIAVLKKEPEEVKGASRCSRRR